MCEMVPQPPLYPFPATSSAVGKYTRIISLNIKYKLEMKVILHFIVCYSYVVRQHLQIEHLSYSVHLLTSVRGPSHMVNI